MKIENVITGIRELEAERTKYKKQFEVGKIKLKAVKKLMAKYQKLEIYKLDVVTFNTLFEEYNMIMGVAE